MPVVSLAMPHSSVLRYHLLRWSKPGSTGSELGAKLSETIFNRVEYDVGHLIKEIKFGRIGLPDIQRPFVWNNTKVRDLFDSMYRGYPVGYLLLWETAASEGHRTIGVGQKEVAPSLVIVDGQQRLTSMYAVFNGVEVIRSSFSRERIRIAFNPLEQKFEVASAATRKDPAFVPDISVVWSTNFSMFRLYNEYVQALRETREVREDETKAIETSLTRLHALASYRLTALQLSAHISEENVADVFVRINSKGVNLKQADFILTLMSVFWDDGRTELETFCRDALKPNTSAPSPFNHFVEPSAERLLRVVVALAFRRARLSSIYSVLRGKDLETGAFSGERREQQFALLKDAQQRTLNLTNWGGFMQCLQQAGFRAKRMINSENALFYSYVLYLIGRTELKVREHDLRVAIARWFFMASLTGRYTGSPESAMESDLAMLRQVRTPAEFVERLAQAERIALTDDFWDVTLPNELATSAARSPSLFGFEAALVILDAPVLFSATKVSEWLDPVVKPAKSIERHHLFPRSFLEGSGISSRQQINQIANYAYVEWQDDIEIGGQEPAQYTPLMTDGISGNNLKRMYELNAIPDGWERMDYDEFLQERRELMARVIREGYQRLTTTSAPDVPVVIDLPAIIAGGEADRVEFKGTLRTNLHTGQKDSRMESAVIKTIAGFLNTHGGTLIIGVADDGNPVGIDADGFVNEDKILLRLTNLVNNRIGAAAWGAIHANFDDYDDVRVLVVRCERAPSPQYVREGNHQMFFVRTGPATVALSVEECVEYIRQHYS